MISSCRCCSALRLASAGSPKTAGGRAGSGCGLATGGAVGTCISRGSAEITVRLTGRKTPVIDGCETVASITTFQRPATSSNGAQMMPVRPFISGAFCIPSMRTRQPSCRLAVACGDEGACTATPPSLKLRAAAAVGATAAAASGAGRGA